MEARPRHGYEIGKLIETQSGGRLVFHLDSLYPLLYRLEERGWIKGAWVEKAGERRRRFYRLTPTGQRVLARQRQTWDEFVEAVRRGRLAPMRLAQGREMGFEAGAVELRSGGVRRINRGTAKGVGRSCTRLCKTAQRSR